MPHREEREFTLRLELAAEFSDSYDGDEDGFAWAEGVGPLAGEIVRAAVDAAQRRGWKVRARNRGRSSEDEVTLVVEKSL
jgi:hypothetical protein